MIMVEGCPSKHCRIGGISVFRRYIGFHAHFVKDAKFVIKVIISTAILVIVFVHFFKGSQRVPISWFIVKSVPLSEISKILCISVVIPKVVLGVPSVAPFFIPCPIVVGGFILSVVRVSRVIPSSVAIPVGCLWGPYGSSAKVGVLLYCLVNGLVCGLIQGLIRG